jgi:hypothetical protein
VDAELDCRDLGAIASCRAEPAAPSAGAFCDLPCSGDTSCALTSSNLECQSGVCRTRTASTESAALGSASGLGGAWWCLDQPVSDPSFTPGRVAGFVAPVAEWSSRTPLAGRRGLTATLCPVEDPSCSQPLAAPYVVSDGMLDGVPLPAGSAGVPVPEGFDGFIRFEVASPPDTAEAEQYIPVAYYLGGPISGGLSQGPPLLLLQRRIFSIILQQSFPAADPQSVQARGLMVSVHDCDLAPVQDARIELQIMGREPEDVLPFSLPASRIPVAQPPNEPLYAAAGGAGYFNVPAGFVTLRAYRRGEEQYIGTVQLGVVQGQISVGAIRPDYFRDASLAPRDLADTGAEGAGQ